ncbi:MAG: FAD-dependent oxidoreductase [Bacteroidales bacterium]|nr:FAD-dependent oxidoreductase [Bacteroidales bacterium]
MNSFDEVHDWVVIGSGAGSMCSALVMRANGNSVLVLEKTELLGGSTARSGGVIWIPNNPFMQRDGIDDSEEQGLAYLNSVISDSDDSPGTSPERRETYVRQAPKMLDFLISRGLRFDRVPCWPDYYDEKPGGNEPGRTVVAEIFDINELGPWKDKLRPGFLPMPAKMEEALQIPLLKRSWGARRALLKIALRIAAGKLAGKKVVSAGMALQGRLLKAGLDAGVAVRTESPVTELIVDAGAVTGVVTVRDGKSCRVGARLGVLVNAGGFAHNQAMRDRYQPGTSTAWTFTSPGDTGEMIEEMMRHGAAIGQMEEMVGHQITLPPGAESKDFKPGAQRITAAPHAILVDQSGVRYMNEGGSYMEFCKGMLERNRDVPAVPSWGVFDSQYASKYTIDNASLSAARLRQWRQQGYLKQGDSIEELAADIGIDPAALSNTVARFNGFVAKGRDEEFHRGARAYDRWLGDPTHKPSPTLGAIDKGPYYAIPVYPGDVSTYGGVVTDIHGRVLNTAGEVIPGLYATGVSTASAMGRFYPGAGCSIGPAMLWGYLSARHAASGESAAD